AICGICGSLSFFGSFLCLCGEKLETMTPIRCENCGLTMPVPPGGRRLCGCGSWLYAAETTEEAEPALEAEPAYPRLEGDLASVERLKDGARRIQDECAK